jgi:hypothetical protein
MCSPSLVWLSQVHTRAGQSPTDRAAAVDRLLIARALAVARIVVAGGRGRRHDVAAGALPGGRQPDLLVRSTMRDSSLQQTVQLRRVARPVILTVAAGLALIAGPFAPETAGRIVLPLAGLVVAGLVYLDLRTSYVAEPGRLTVPRPGASGSVDLSQLTAAETQWVTTLGRGGRYVLVLTDHQGSTARLDLAGTTMVPRRRLLDALAPYIRAPAVHWEGQIDRALSGVPWNRGFRSAQQCGRR